eukprot:365053-Chlamydomonas_euryale.AAC.1
MGVAHDCRAGGGGGGARKVFVALFATCDCALWMHYAVRRGSCALMPPTHATFPPFLIHTHTPFAPCPVFPPLLVPPPKKSRSRLPPPPLHPPPLTCRCHSTENLYRMTNTAVARVSDDFYPREPASSSPHIAACAYNSVFMSALVQPDWDMFHSMHPSAETHAIARALSGGAVYVSDKPGDHDFALLRLLVLPDGSTLRAAGAARPSRDCLFADVLRDGRSLLKAWNTNRGGGRVVGVYHLQGSSWDRTRRKFHVHDAAPRALATTVQPADCEAGAAELHPAAASPPRYAMYTVRGKALAVVGGGGRDGVRVELAAGEAEAVAVAPLLDVGSSSVALIGLCDMYNSGGAVLGVDVVASSNGSGGGTCNVSMRGCGRFLAHCSVAPSSVAWRGNGQSGAPTALEFTYDASSGAMHVEVPRTDDMRATLTIAFD